MCNKVVFNVHNCQDVFNNYIGTISTKNESWNKFSLQPCTWAKSQVRPRWVAGNNSSNQMSFHRNVFDWVGTYCISLLYASFFDIYSNTKSRGSSNEHLFSLWTHQEWEHPPKVQLAFFFPPASKWGARVDRGHWIEYQGRNRYFWFWYCWAVASKPRCLNGMTSKSKVCWVEKLFKKLWQSNFKLRKF